MKTSKKSYENKPEVTNKRKRREAAYRQQEPVKKKRKISKQSCEMKTDVINRRKKRESSYRLQPAIALRRQCNQSQLKFQKLKDKEDIIKVIEEFKAKCLEIPGYVCCCCKRIKFRNQVRKMVTSHYLQNSQNLQACGIDDKSIWVCLYCHNYLKKRQNPLNCSQRQQFEHSRNDTWTPRP